MLKPTTILHISDIHIESGPDKVFDRSVVLEPLLKRVTKDYTEGLRPELVAVTGDVSFKGIKDEFDLAVLFFNDLLDAVKLSRERILIVPGNHDVNRKKYRPTDVPVYETMNKLNYELENYRDELFKGMVDYFAFIKSAYPHLCGIEGDLIPFVTPYESESGKKIGILGLNSAWMCRKSPDENEVAIGEYQIKNAVNELKKSGKTDLDIYLFHHSINHLWSTDRNACRNHIDGDKTILLTGHMHEPVGWVMEDYIGRLVQFQAGGAYLGTESEWPSRYQYISIDWDNNAVRLDFRAYDKDKRTWHVDAKTGDDGHKEFELFKPSQTQKLLQHMNIVSCGQSPSPSIYIHNFEAEKPGKYDIEFSVLNGRVSLKIQQQSKADKITEKIRVILAEVTQIKELIKSQPSRGLTSSDTTLIEALCRAVPENVDSLQKTTLIDIKQEEVVTGTAIQVTPFHCDEPDNSHEMSMQYDQSNVISRELVLQPDLFLLLDLMKQALSVWNIDKALSFADQIEQLIKDEFETINQFINARIYFQLARVHIIYAERQANKAKEHINRAKSFLSRTDDLLTGVPNDELAADIEALKGSIEHLELGPDAALSRLDGRTDPYAIRIRMAMLMKKQDLDGAIALIEDQPPNERWCDLAVTIYALKGLREEAKRILNWAATREDRSRYPQCVVRYSEALLAHLLGRQKNGDNIHPHDLTEEERIDIRAVLEALRPVVDPIYVNGRVDSELGITAINIAWRVNHLLGNREEATRLATLMSTHRPVPLDFARSVVTGYVAPTPDLPSMIREDYPGDLDANLLATIIQSAFLGQHEEALAWAKELVPLADTENKKEELLKLFNQLWQELGGTAASDCERIAFSLAAHSSKLCIIVEAAKHIREADPDAAILALDKAKDEEDIYWLQLRANACLQKKQLDEAVDYLLIAAKKTLDPVILRKTADFAAHAEKLEIAVWCYERLLEMEPNNTVARGNLVFIYMSQLHDVKNTVVHLRVLHKADPLNPVYPINLAVCLAKLYRPLESLSLYDEACAVENPDIRAILGRAELHLCMGNPDAALDSLQKFRQAFSLDPNFLLAFTNIAFTAGDDDAANEALIILNNLRENSQVPPEAFKMVSSEEGLEFLKKRMKEAQERTTHLHNEMIEGRMPWVWAELVSGNAIYWGWRRRTGEMAWIGDDPANKANFCIYSTNTFHPRKSKNNRRELLQLECPAKGTRIVADISALITLHRLELLDTAANYFEEIIVPEDYLETVLEDSRKLVPNQRSQQKNAEWINKKTELGVITVIKDNSEPYYRMPFVDEYDEASEHRYRMIDLIRPVYIYGVINETDHERITKVCTKMSSVDETHSDLSYLQEIKIDLITLETITNFGLLDAITGFYKVYISEEAHAEILQRQQFLKYQEETLAWHFDLWNKICDDKRFKFVPINMPGSLWKKNVAKKDYLAFLASFIAKEQKAPLLVDDRLCQATALNERPKEAYPAFGTDALIYSLMTAGKLETSRASKAILTLMNWRYRFILPREDILKSFAEQYRTNPPGRALQEIAEYIHDTMRDEGLFGGSEKTEHGESIAARQYISWISVIAKFLVSIWDDTLFPEESAKQLTEWTVLEFLPSTPRKLDNALKIKFSLQTPLRLMSYVLSNSSLLDEGKRIPDCMMALKYAFKLSDNVYLRIVTEILKTTRQAKTGSKEMREVFRIMSNRICKFTLFHFTHIDARTFRMLQTLGLFKGKPLSKVDNLDLSVLRNSENPQREKLPSGPFVIYTTAGEKPVRMVVELPVVLFSDIPEERKAALRCLEGMIKNKSFAITPKTADIFKKVRNSFNSNSPDRWKPAAIAINDALDDDILVSLQGVSQCLAGMPAMQENLISYVPKIFHPAISSLNSISLEIANPQKEHGKILNTIANICREAKTLTDVCAGYYEKLGYLPLAPPYGMVAAVEQWLASHPETGVWSEIWKWAYESFGPIPKYHACSIFVLHPEFVPKEKMPDLWDEILAVVYLQDKEDENEKIRAEWALRFDLARHYACHLEAHIPGCDSEGIACFAWWFSEQVAGLFPESEDIRFYRENWVQPALSISSKIWVSAFSYTQRSFLQHVTLSLSSPWAVGLLSIMGENFTRLAPDIQSEEIKGKFHSALISNIISSLPFPVNNPPELTYAFECSLRETALKWAEYQPEEQKAPLTQLVGVSQLLGTADGLCKALRGFGESPQADQLAISIALKTKAYLDPTIADGIWEIVSDAKWRNKVLANVEPLVLASLIEAFSILHIDNKENNKFLLPHYISELCEKAEDEERRRYLFLCLIYTSLSTETVSAVRRLLRGEHKAKYIEHIKEYRNQTKALVSYYPPWVAGRLRGLIANLRVV